MSTSGLEVLLQVRESIRSLEAVPTEIADEITAEVRRYFAERVRSQTAPDGTPWPATKYGGQALANAFDNLIIEIRSTGTSLFVVAKLGTQPDVLHNTGHARNAPQRRLMPTGDELDAAIGAKIRAIVQRGVSRRLQA